MQCTAHSARTGLPCKRRAVTGYTVCCVHGAGKPGIGRPGGRPIVNGRWSKYLPNRLAEKYNEASKDPELLNLRQDIGLIDARVSDVLSRVDTGEAGAMWKAAKDYYRSIEAAIAESDPIAMRVGMNQLGEVLGKGIGDWAAWNEVIGLLEQRRKLVDTERKRLIDMNQMISSEKAVLMITAITSVIREKVTDREVMNSIIYGIRALMFRPEEQEKAPAALMEVVDGN
jgi:hypothetical protein